VKINIDPRILTIVGATMTAVSGACWGYVYATHELEEKFQDNLQKILDVEIDKVQRYYAILNKETSPEDHSEPDYDPDDVPEDVVVDHQEIRIPKELLATPEGRAAVMASISEAIEPEDEENLDEEDEPAPIEMNAFDEQALLDERGNDRPYVISKEEFFRNDAHYETHKLTFFEGDGVLIDEDDDAIPDTEFVVGDKNLTRFGMLSGNNNVVYIQNDQTEALFEVHRSRGTAAEELFGVPDEDELAHSAMMKRRRHRRGDE
jgi:hypothetical protein